MDRPKTGLNNENDKDAGRDIVPEGVVDGTDNSDLTDSNAWQRYTTKDVDKRPIWTRARKAWETSI